MRGRPILRILRGRELGKVWGCRILWLFFLIAATLPNVTAEQLPVRIYTAADGLPRDSVSHIKQDSRGFLWVFTGDGLTRFDGYDFITYTTDDGLPDRRVNDLLETRVGVYWLATERGLCRFNPRGVRNPQSEEPMFVVYNPGDSEKPVAINLLWEDDAGVIWCGTDRGLYRLRVTGSQVGFELVDLGKLTASKYEGVVTAIVKDRRGSLWVASDTSGLYRLLPDGHAERYTTEHGLPSNQIASLLHDHDGNVWVGIRALTGGLCRLVSEPDPTRPVVARIYTKKDGLPSEWIPSLYQTRDGRVWVGTVAGLCSFVPSALKGKPSFQVYSAQNGFCDLNIWGLVEDRDGNFWVASQCSLMKIARNGFTLYNVLDGLSSSAINSISESRDGELLVINFGPAPQGRIINRFDRQKFTATKPRLPSRITYQGWGWGQTIIQDHTGEWWVPTGHDALFRFPRVDGLEQLASINPKAVYSTRDGLPGSEVFRLYEDRRGDIWIATTGVRTGLARWERSTGVFHDLTEQTGVPPKTDFTAFREDAKGNLWIGTAGGGVLLRYKDGRFRRFTIEDGVPPGWIIFLHLDQAGRLWIASQLGGLNRIDDPAAESLQFVRYTTADGLSSNSVRTITEDAWGRIYAGTGHGVDRLDPETGRVKHYTVADGLPKNVIEHAFRDRQGALWFGSPFGVARLVPELDETSQPPTVYINGLSIEGVAQRISELGETELPARELQPSQNQVGIDFVGLGFNLGEELQYQYKLEGADNDWSAPTSRRSVTYASLSPGAYRFMVRAVTADGHASPTPATFSFSILSPIWQRPWFIALFILVIGITVYALYRYRLARLLEVANMRTRIATDLHDDIGANLTKIAILSEVAKQQRGDGDGDGDKENDSPLSSIARISRESVASMGDIVWAINPQRDSLLDLVRRMRRHAEDIFTTRDIALEFRAPGAGEHLKLGVDVRRAVFLIFKEAINNAARYSQCSRVEIDFRADGPGLFLQIEDDGIGFNPAAESEGQGLTSMRRRAQALNGTLEIESRAGGGGTTIRLRVIRGRQHRTLS